MSFVTISKCELLHSLLPELEEMFLLTGDLSSYTEEVFVFK